MNRSHRWMWFLLTLWCSVWGLMAGAGILPPVVGFFGVVCNVALALGVNELSRK
ncbi:MAG TPA: hypothetical protein VNA32_00280 [Actinomycetota bacterium]|nr:hypothetical protein [Actinomycetota bacterium]